MKSPEAAGSVPCHSCGLVLDGFSQMGILFSHLLSRLRVGKSSYFNQVAVPEFWDIAAITSRRIS